MKVFEPFSIGSVTVKNRVVMAPMTTNLAENGFVSEQTIAYYKARAEGGVGLIEVEPGTVEYPRGNLLMTNIAVDQDRYLPGLSKLAAALHTHGAKISMQLAHGGRRAGRVSPDTGCLEVTRGFMPVAPSPLPHPVPGHVVPYELTEEEIELYVERFVQSSERLSDAGFDFISLHCAHMYLCGQFLSPWANHRTDKYGSDLDGRLRFILEIVAGIRHGRARNLPIICRINGDEPLGGNTRDEIKEIARRLERAGVAALHVSTGFGIPIKDPNFIPSVTPMRTPDKCIVHLAEDLRRIVNIPVITVNKIKDINAAEEVLQAGQADLIAMGRPLIADPDLIAKTLRNESDEIRPCIYCCQGCLQRAAEKSLTVACNVNPLAGRETTPPLAVAVTKKKVLVVGAGPAGMQAALTSVARGHEVFLVEREPKMGGQLLIASRPPGKKNIDRLTRYLVRQVEKSKIELRLSEELTASLLDQIKPDVIILATGSRPIMPKIKGVDCKVVLTAWEVLAGASVKGEKILVLGGGTVGCETAEFLAEQSKKVTIVEALEETARGMPEVARIPLEFALAGHGVRIMRRARVLEVRDEGAIVEHGKKEEMVPADAIIVAVGAERCSDVNDLVKEKATIVLEIGDQIKPRSILEAIREGFDVGMKI